MATIDNAMKTTSIDLPVSVSKEIIQKTQEASAVMKLARSIDLPGNGIAIPVILGDPEPEWVAETENKPVSKASLGTKIMQPYTMAVIVPFSNQFKKNYPALYNAILERLPLAMAQKFDNTVFGGTAVPGDKFDSLSGVTAANIGTNPYDALVDVDLNISENDGITNGYVLSPKGKAILLKAKDNDGRPIFVNSVAENAIPRLLGSPTYMSKGAYVAGTPNTVGWAGDWTKATYGVPTSLSMSVSDQATLTVGTETINLWQRNMFAVRCEFEIGFRADTTVFNKLTATS